MTHRVLTSLLRFLPIVFALLILSTDQPAQSSAVRADYCRLFGRDSVSRAVETEALLFVPNVGGSRVDGGTDRFFYSTACNGPDNFVLAELGRFVPPKSLGRDLILRVRFVARLEVNPAPVFGEMGWLRSRAAVIRIRSLVRADADTTLPDLRAPAPIIDAARTLLDINSQLLFSFQGSKIVRIGTRTISIKRLELAGRGFDALGRLPDGDRRIVNPAVVRTGPIWRVSGRLEVRSPGGLERFSFDVVWRESGEALTVESLRLAKIR